MDLRAYQSAASVTDFLPSGDGDNRVDPKGGPVRVSVR